MKTIIAGGRTFTNYAALLHAVARSDFFITEVVSGKAEGVDALGERWADEFGIPVKPFPADWDDIDAPGAVVRTRHDGKRYNAKAGHDRNVEMAKYADALIALWDGKSKGTKDMIDLARLRNLHIFILRV